MQRRRFLKGLCKAVGVAVVVPTALASTSTPVFDVDRLQRHVIHLKARRKGMSWTYAKYWFEKDSLKAQTKWQKEQEQKLWKHILTNPLY